MASRYSRVSSLRLARFAGRPRSHINNPPNEANTTLRTRTQQLMAQGRAARPCLPILHVQVPVGLMRDAEDLSVHAVLVVVQHGALRRARWHVDAGIGLAVLVERRRQQNRQALAAADRKLLRGDVQRHFRLGRHALGHYSVHCARGRRSPTLAALPADPTPSRRAPRTLVELLPVGVHARHIERLVQQRRSRRHCFLSEWSPRATPSPPHAPCESHHPIHSSRGVGRGRGKGGGAPGGRGCWWCW